MLIDAEEENSMLLLLSLFVIAVLVFARQLIGLRAEDTLGTARVAVAVADAGVLKRQLIWGVGDTDRATLLLLFVAFRAEDAACGEVIWAVLIALPALVLRSGVPSDLSPDVFVTAVVLEGRVTYAAAWTMDRVVCFNLDWAVGLFAITLALEAARVISRLVFWSRPEDVSLQYG
jgi:hypothetical protein